MRMIIGLFIFWLSTFGYIQLLKKKTKLPMEFSLPTIFTIISISMFIGGILNMLKEFAVIICILGIVLLFYSIIKKEIEFRKLLNFNFIAIFLILLCLTIICKDMHLMIYDNFSHWGLIVKSMFMKNCLPNFESIIEFRDYQPGSACFIYYFSLFAGKTEGNAIIAQNYLIVSFFFSLFAFTNGKNKINYLSKILLIVSFLFILFGNVQFYDLPVDTLISVISICSLSVIYYFRKDLKRAFSYVLPFSVYLFLVKNVGIILVGLNCLALLYIGYKNKELKKGFIYAVYTTIITLIFYYIWSKHVSYVYYIGNTISKHSLRLNNIAASIKGYGIDRTKTFLNIYFNHFMDVFNLLGFNSPRLAS